MSVTKRELFTMKEQDAELVLNPEIKKAKEIADLAKQKEDIINIVSIKYSHLLNDVLNPDSDDLISKDIWSRVLKLLVESYLFKQKVTSIKNIVSSEVLKWLLKFENNETNI